MSKKYDLLIFGATGFTARFVVERLVKTIKKCNHLSNFRWAMAARNIDNMKKYIQEIENICQTDLQSIPIYKTDLNDVNSLNNIFKKCILVMNCVGPYSLLGESVVKSCINSNAHYMDLSGEPLFMEKMFLKYDQLAKEKNITAVSSCGFDSIPADLGLSYLKQNFPGRLNQTEQYLLMWTEGKKFNYATWRALIEGYKYRNQLKLIRKELFSKYKHFEWPVKLERKIFQRNEFGYCVPFPGSDRSVAIRSQMHRYTYFNELPAQFEAYFAQPKMKDILKLVFMHANLRFLSKAGKFGDKLLQDYEQFFSFGLFEQNTLPDRKSLEANKFRLTLVGNGWSDDCKTLNKNSMDQCSLVNISGGDLAYIDTAKIAVQTALTLLEQIQSNKSTPGILTPAMAFQPNELIPRLQNEGIEIKFIQEYKK